MQKETLEGYRLSPQQKHLWLQQAGEGQVFRSQCAIGIEGRVDSEVLDICLRQVVERNEILRTSFNHLPGMLVPAQVVAAMNAISVFHLDLQGLASIDQQATLESEYAEIAQKPFDYDQGKLLHATLITLSSEKNILIISISSLCADSRGLENLVWELGRNYAVQAGASDVLEEPVQYADVSEVLNEAVEAEDSESGRAYWRQLDLARTLATKLGFERAGGQPFCPQSVRLEIDQDLVAEIERLWEQLAVSTSSIYMACWHTLLWRLSCRAELVLGALYDGRNYEGLDRALGLYARYLPVKVGITEETRFATLVEQIENACREAADWQECFSWEGTELGSGALEEDARYLPFTYAYHRAPEAMVAGEVEFRMLEETATIERFRLELLCRESRETVRCELRYDAGAFSREQVLRVAGEYETLLKSATSAPEETLAELRLLPGLQRQELCEGLNAERRDVEARLVHELIEEQATRTPEATAVIYKERELSYEELEMRANKMAHRLVDLGVGPEVMVAVYMPRGFEMVVSLLGILKAGGAYVPIDVSFPRQRVKYMLEDSGAAIVLTVSAKEEEVTDSWVKVVSVDEEWEAMDQGLAERPAVRVERENAAYVIYTSGTTGTPKGVVVSHGSLSNHMQWMREAVGLERIDRVLQKTSVSFDASVWEFYLPLISGAALVMLEEGAQRESRLLVDAIKEQKVSVLQGVPTLLRMLVAEDGLSECKSLRRVMSGGEALSEELAEELRVRTGAEVVNLYGPTEATIEVSYKVSAKRGEGERVSIGRPIWNAEMYVVEGERELAPVGMRGEIYLGGEGLARGYSGRAAETAERFVPDWLSGRGGGERLYRTGDVGRVNDEWEIEYVGRVDEQVKVRGHRVEIKEVEEVMRRQRGVMEAAVVAEEELGGGTRLVGYVEVTEEGISGKEIRRQMREEVPEYMVPAEVVVVEGMPVTGSGKVDKRRLAEVKRRGGDKRESGERRSAVEEVVAGIWEELLQLDHVRGEDNFFDLGGHSLVATLAVARVQDAFQVDIQVRSIFEHPVLSDFSIVCEEAIREGHGLHLPAITRFARGQELPLSFAQQRLWFVQQLDPDSYAYNMGFHKRLQGSLKVNALEQTLNEITRRHEILRTTFGDIDGRPVQRISPEGGFKLPVVDLSLLDEQARELEAQHLAYREDQRPFDMKRGPLMRAVLLICAEQEHIILLSMHHIISDGVSNDVFTRELCLLYESFANRLPSPLTDLPIQYADFACWQNQWLQGETLEAQINYWKQQLGGELPILDLPIDKPRPVKQSFCGASHSILLDAELTTALKSLSRRENVTLFMTLMAAFKALLACYTGQHDIPVGTPIANRNRVETEGLIGFFVNTLVMRTDLGGNPTLRELLKRIRETALGAYAHQDMPFEKLVEVLQPERDLGRNPLFQVMFASVEVSRDDDVQTELAITRFGGGIGKTIFDLVFTVADAGDVLAATLTYNTDMFEPETITGMMQNFNVLLAAFAADLEQTLSDLPVKVERKTLPPSFEAQAVSAQAATAVHSTQQDREKARRAALAARKASLSADRRAMLQERLRGEAATSADIATIPRRQNREVAPLSFAQQRLWFLDQLMPGSAIYNVPIAMRLSGLLNADSLEQAIKEVVKRHEVLRTVFSTRGEEAVQIINPDTDFALSRIDLSGMPASEREQEAKRLAREEYHIPFDLARGPLLRVTLLEMGAEEHCLLFTIHHIVSDGWSMSVLVGEVMRLYDDFCEGRAPTLPDLPIQYADFASWQREWLQGEVLEKQLSYWRQQLEGAPAALEFQIDRSRPATLSNRGAGVSFEISEALTNAIRALGQEEEATLFMTLLAAFLAILNYHTRQEDIVVGTNVANRTRSATEGLIGFFVNILPLRTSLSGDPTFRELLGRAREVALGAYAHQDLPFEKIVAELRPDRGTSLMPLAQVLLILQSGPGQINGISPAKEDRAPAQNSEIARLSFGEIEVEATTAKYDLMLSATESSAGIICTITYSLDLFEAAFIKQMAEHFVHVLEDVVVQPDRRLSAIRKTLEETNRRRHSEQVREFKQTRSSKLKTAQPKPIDASGLKGAAV